MKKLILMITILVFSCLLGINSTHNKKISVNLSALKSFHLEDKLKPFDKENKMKKESKKHVKKVSSKKSRKESPKFLTKVKKVIHEFKARKLHSGSKKGPKVKSRKQSIAIALSEAKKDTKK